MTPRIKAPATVCGYVRCSTTEQVERGVTLDAQSARIRDYCASHNLILGRLFSDGGVSGGTPLSARPEGRELVASIARREIALIVACKLDRLFRSTLDALVNVQSWDKARVAIVLLDFGGGHLDTRSPTGRLMLTMTSAFAEMERSLIGERTSAALRHIQAQGTRLGGTPFGFRTESPGGPLLPNERELTAVREILRRRTLRGGQASYRAIARQLTDAGVPTRHGGAWKPETIRRIVNRRDLYMGRT